jgi:hypothetical protein
MKGVKMYKNTPKPQNRSAKSCALICLIVGALMFAFSGIDIIMWKWFPQTVGVIFLTASIYIASVYLLRYYTFAVTERNDTTSYDLVIHEFKGKRSMTVCRIGLDDIVSARVVDKQNKKTVSAERKDKKRYTYDVTFLPSRQVEIVAEIDDEILSILITYDQELLDMIEKNKIK